MLASSSCMSCKRCCSMRNKSEFCSWWVFKNRLSATASMVPRIGSVVTPVLPPPSPSLADEPSSSLPSALLKLCDRDAIRRWSAVSVKAPSITILLEKPDALPERAWPEASVASSSSADPPVLCRVNATPTLAVDL